MPLGILAKLLGWTGLPQWAIEVLAIAAALGIVYGYHRYAMHEAAVRAVAEYRQELDAQSAKLKAEAQAKIAANTRQNAAADAAVVGALNAQFSKIAADRDDLARRLRDAEAAHRRNTVLACPAGGPAAARQGAGSTPGVDVEFDRLGQVALDLRQAGAKLDAALAACEADRHQLNGR